MRLDPPGHVTNFEAFGTVKVNFLFLFSLLLDLSAKNVTRALLLSRRLHTHTPSELERSGPGWDDGILGLHHALDPFYRICWLEIRGPFHRYPGEQFWCSFALFANLFKSPLAPFEDKGCVQRSECFCENVGCGPVTTARPAHRQL